MVMIFARASFIGALGSLLISPVQGADPAVRARLPEGVRTGSYQGWGRSLYLEARDPDALAVVVPAVGGRIMHYGLHSQNLLFELPGAGGTTFEKDKDVPWVGGYQCGVGPIEGAAVQKAALSGAHNWSAPREMSVRLEGPADLDLGVQMTKDILMDPETGDLGLEQRVRNRGDQAFTGRLWGRTLCRSGGFIIVPVAKSRRLPAGWGLGQASSDTWETARPQAEGVSLKRGILVVRASGPSTRLAVETAAGWIAYTRGRTLFVQYFLTAGDSGSTDVPGNEIRFDLAAVEMRVFGAEFTLAPGAEHVVPAKWTLEALEKDVTTEDQARALAHRIPPSPFRALGR